ncbi:MAG TPA: ABC transporter permease [Thermoplasmata archaeon]|nr:ABC transporter permease [Thermoplasmata archaeon]
MTATANVSGKTPSATMGSVPETWRQALLLSRYQLRDYLRSRRFILMMLIVAAIGAILSFILAYYHGTDVVSGLTSSSDAFYGSLWGGGVYVVIIFSGIIFGGDAIAGEFQNKTGYFLMGLPIRRTAVYAGKFVAAVGASIVAMLFYLAILVGNGVAYLGTGFFPLALLESFAIALLYLLALLGAVFLFSSLFKNSLYAVLVVAILFLFGFTIIMELVVALVKIEPWFIIDYARATISYPFLSTLPPHISTQTLMGPRGSTTTSTTYNPTYPEGLAIMAGYFILTAIAGLFLFEREEFN